MRQPGISLTPVARQQMPAPKFRLGAQLECRQTGLRFSVVGTPQDCEYLPTGERVYLCCEDTLERRILVMPAPSVEADLVEVTSHPIRDMALPAMERRRFDRRTSNGTRPAGDPD